MHPNVLVFLAIQPVKHLFMIALRKPLALDTVQVVGVPHSTANGGALSAGLAGAGSA